MQSLPLFRGADAEILHGAFVSGYFSRQTFSAGEEIYTPEKIEKKLIIFLSGKAEIYSADESRSLLLRTMTAGGVIGVSNLFSEESFVSRVIAAKRCDTLQISAEDFGRLIEQDRAILYNYIDFLSGRICYLNKKIVYLTAGTAERRLAYYLDSLACDAQSDAFELNTPINALAEMLNLGRASLYRALDRLESDGHVLRKGKSFRLFDRATMLERYK